jgi:hypothetical protein
MDAMTSSTMTTSTTTIRLTDPDATLSIKNGQQNHKVLLC